VKIHPQWVVMPGKQTNNKQEKYLCLEPLVKQLKLRYKMVVKPVVVCGSKTWSKTDVDLKKWIHERERY
jgi:hypothetical protein